MHLVHCTTDGNTVSVMYSNSLYYNYDATLHLHMLYFLHTYVHSEDTHMYIHT